MTFRSSIPTILCIAALVAMLVQFRTMKRPAELKNFHIDELYWIGSTYYFHLAWSEPDWTHSDWQLLPARENPPFGKYMMGAWLAFHGKPVTDINLLGTYFTHFRLTLPLMQGDGETVEKRLRVESRMDPKVIERITNAHGRVTLDPEQLILGRNLSLLLGILATVGVFLMGYGTRGAFTGFVSAYLFGHHPIFEEVYKRAMIDVIAITFSIYAMICFVYLITRLARPVRSRRDRWIDAFLGGLNAILVAMACGSKMNSLVVVGVILLITMFCVVETWTGYGARIFKAFADVGRDSKLVRLLTGDPSSRPERVLDQDVSSGQHPVDFREICVRVVVWAGGILTAALLIFVAFNPTVLQDPIGGLNALFEEHRITGELQAKYVGAKLNTPVERWRVVFDRLIWDPVWNVIIFAAVVWHSLRGIRQRDASCMILVWWTVSLVMILAWIPFAWSRYFLPLIPPTALLLGSFYADCIVLAIRAVTLPMMTRFFPNASEAT
jgi:hypothetical protein